MKHSITIWTSLIVLTLYTCSLKENNKDVETKKGVVDIVPILKYIDRIKINF